MIDLAGGSHQGAGEGLAMRVMLVVVLLILCAPREARAQARAPLPRAEIVAAWTVPLPASSGTLRTDYAPPLLLGGTVIESRSTQELTVDAGAGSGVEFGANVFFNRVAGVQAALAWDRRDISGVNPDYRVFLHYVAMQPPDYVPREFTYDQSFPWSDTTGTLRRLSLALGGVVRWSASDGRAGGTVAGGASHESWSGSIESVAYSQFVLGGHATLLPVRHRVLMEPAEGEGAWRPYVAADVQVRVATHLALFGGVRAVFGSAVTLATDAEGLVDPDENPWTPEIDDVRERLGAVPLDLPGAQWRVVFGAKVLVGA